MRSTGKVGGSFCLAEISFPKWDSSALVSNCLADNIAGRKGLASPCSVIAQSEENQNVIRLSFMRITLPNTAVCVHLIRVN